MARTPGLSTERQGELLRALFKSLLDSPDGLPGREALDRMKELVPFTEYERGHSSGIRSTVLTKPMRDGAESEIEALAALLGRLDLRPLDEAVAELAAVLGATHGLRAADAVHLATAVAAGATYPDELPET